MTTPRGIRNNNPGNIEYTGEQWQGLDTPPSDGRFCRFQTPAFGIRAIARVLITYRDRHGINTIRDAINRWAPPAENDTAAYIAHVAAKCGVTPVQPVDLGSYQIARPLVETIILHECGQQPYTPAQIDKGLTLAGIEPPPAPLSQSRTVKGGQVAAGAGILSVFSGIVDQAQPAMPFLQTAMFYAPWIVGGLVLLGVGYMLWARLDDRRRGLR